MVRDSHCAQLAQVRGLGSKPSKKVHLHRHLGPRLLGLTPEPPTEASPGAGVGLSVSRSQTIWQLRQNWEKSWQEHCPICNAPTLDAGFKSVAHYLVLTHLEVAERAPASGSASSAECGRPAADEVQEGGGTCDKQRVREHVAPPRTPPAGAVHDASEVIDRGCRHVCLQDACARHEVNIASNRTGSCRSKTRWMDHLLKAGMMGAAVTKAASTTTVKPKTRAVARTRAGARKCAAATGAAAAAAGKATAAHTATDFMPRQQRMDQTLAQRKLTPSLRSVSPCANT